MKQTIAVAMIVRGVDSEAPLLAKCLASISRYVDDIYIQLNHGKDPISVKVRRVAEQYSNHVFSYDWEDNFVKARNDIFSKVPKKYDWIMWLDADDTVKNPEKIKDAINVASKTISGVYIQYDYAHDEYGNCTVSHWICRLCRNDGSYSWQSSIDDGGVAVHETLTAVRTVQKARNDEFKIIHHSDGKRRAESLVRNIKLLEGMYQRQIKNNDIDPRVLYYLATHYFDAGKYESTENLLIEYLKLSGWAEERSEAWVYLGLVCKLNERIDAARQSFVRSISENPKNPRPYVELGELEFQDKRYNMSEEWLTMAVNKKEQETASVVLPMENKYRAYMLLAQTYINMGFSKLKDAAKYVNMALKLRPTDPDAKNAQELIENLHKTRSYTQAVARFARMFDEAETPEKILPVLNLLPNDMQDNPAVITLRQKYQKPTKWPKKSIVIFCGNSAEDIWGPWGLTDGGMGGSEEAVIQMSEELVVLGWAVTVYATPGSRAGVYEGVVWKQYWEFNPRDTFDVFIAWRMPWWFDLKVKARKNYLWLHDVMDKSEFTKERLANIDKVIFVSQYHAELYGGIIPKEKWFVSGNGIDPTQFEKYDDKFERDPHRCLYMSSHVRGLEILYEIWPEVIKKVPDATLDVYYGWKTFDNANKDNPERMAYKDKMVKWAKKLPGVTDRGRIDHDQIAQETFKSGILAYPCVFPEVYCISLIKSQAGGMYPVTSDYAVMKNFNLAGKQVHVDFKKLDKFKKEYKEALIKALTLHPENKQSKTIRNNFSWEKTATDWNEQMK